MEIWVVVAALFLFSGLMFYFRLTDARNVSVRELQHYIRQAEKKVEQFVRKKEKDFQDKMIASEIVIDRMNRLAQTLQEKVEIFDRDLTDGQELFEALRLEAGDVSHTLAEYKRIRAEFIDIEDRIVQILNMKDHAESGRRELDTLHQEMEHFRNDYHDTIAGLKDNSEQELKTFFANMQKDLTSYLEQAREQLREKDRQIAEQMQEFGERSELIFGQINDLKSFSEASIDNLKDSFEVDLTHARTMAQTNIEEVYDMWAGLREKAEEEKIMMENNLQEKDEFFRLAKAKLQEEMDQVSENIDIVLQEKLQYLENSAGYLSRDLELLGSSLKINIEKNLDDKIDTVKSELDRIHSAFIAQEESLENEFKQLSHRFSEQISNQEKEVQINLKELQASVHSTKDLADDILKQSQEKILEKIKEFEEFVRQKAQENMQRIEDSFREENQERMFQSISEITKTLEVEYQKKYQETIDTIAQKSEDLSELVSQKIDAISLLDRQLEDILRLFDSEKEKIILMGEELQKDREQNIITIKRQMEETAQHLQNELQVNIQGFFDEGTETYRRDREIWQEHFDDTLGEARSAYQNIQNDIDEIKHMMRDIETSSLNNLKSESLRLTEETERRIDELKKYTDNFLRSNKDDFMHHVEQAKSDMKNIKQELWDQERLVRDQVNKEFERLSGRVRDVDKNFHSLMKKTEMLERAENLAAKLSGRLQEIEAIRKEMNTLVHTFKDSHIKSQETIDDLRKYNDVVESNIQRLDEKSIEASNIQDFLVSVMDEAKETAKIFQVLKEEQDHAREIQELLMKNLASYNDLQESLVVLEDRKAVVEEMLKNIDQISRLGENTEDLISRLDAIDSFSSELQDKLALIQGEMHQLAGDQTQVRNAVSKLSELEHVTAHIDEEMKRLDKMREWVAKAINNIERVGAATGVGSPGGNKPELGDEAIKNIVRLHEQNWSVSDIAKNLKVSPTWVELILERYRS